MKRTANASDKPDIAKQAPESSENGIFGGEPSALTGEMRLKAYETMHKQICAKQEELSKKLEQLRADGKKNTVKFRELMGEKLINTAILSLYKAHGLE